MPHKFIYVVVLSAMVSSPAIGYADETAKDSGQDSGINYSEFEDLQLRRDFSGISHFYIVRPQEPAYSGDDNASDGPYTDVEGSSAGGYITFETPSTTTFFGSVHEKKGESWIDGVEFSFNLRPDVSGGEHQDYRSIGRSFAGSEIDRVGVRADLTALLYDETWDNSGSTAWRVTGMLGSTSLSLLSLDDGIGLESRADSGGFMWDIGVGWSSGAMSLNASYQSASVIDGPPDEIEDGLGAVIIVGSGISF
jgi:hypothetical protein